MAYFNRLRRFFALSLFLLAFVVTQARAEEPDAGSTSSGPVQHKTIKKTRKKKKRIVKKKAHRPAKRASTATLPSEKSSTEKKNVHDSLQIWLQKMKKNVARSQAKHTQLVAVASVRGNEIPDSPPLYWKGKKAKGLVQPDEIQDFDKALDLALNGDRLGAKSKLEAFLLSYPDSSLKNDALYTIEMLGSPEPKP